MPADAPVISAVSAIEWSLFRIFGRRVAAIVPEWVRTSGHGGTHPHVRGPDPILGVRVPLGAGDALISGAKTRAGTGQSRANTVPAGPGQDRALEGVPAAEAQDPGVRG